MTDTHEALVEKVARKLTYCYEIEDGLGEKNAERAAAGPMHKNFITTARAIVALIAEETKEPTEIMYRERAKIGSQFHSPGYGESWSVMHRASALWPRALWPRG